MIDRIKTRLAKEESGFTLIELLVVMIILAILMAIAIPSYLGFKQRATDSALKSDVRAAIPDVEAFAGDHSDSYTGVDATGALTSYDSGLSSAVTVKPSADGTHYCISATKSGTTWTIAQEPGADLSNSTAWTQDPCA
jgi:type IV pilus assembly protein PilA